MAQDASQNGTTNKPQHLCFLLHFSVLGSHIEPSQETYWRSWGGLGSQTPSNTYGFVRCFVSEGFRFLGLLITMLVHLGSVLGQHGARAVFAFSLFESKINDKNIIWGTLFNMSLQLVHTCLNTFVGNFWSHLGVELWPTSGKMVQDDVNIGIQSSIITNTIRIEQQWNQTLFFLSLLGPEVSPKTSKSSFAFLTNFGFFLDTFWSNLKVQSVPKNQQKTNPKKNPKQDPWNNHANHGRKRKCGRVCVYLHLRILSEKYKEGI